MGVYYENDNWHIDYRLPNGKRRREKVGSSKKLAEIVLGKRKVEIAEGRFLDVRKNEKIKFEDFAAEFLNIHSKVNKKSWKSDFYNLGTLEKYFGPLASVRPVMFTVLPVATFAFGVKVPVDAPTASVSTPTIPVKPAPVVVSVAPVLPS